MSKSNTNNENSSMPDNKKNNGTEKIKSLSIKEQMMGVKSTKPLPKDLYEKILECEMSLKEKFDTAIMQNLLLYYSIAVEHFNSLGDEKKAAEYNENMNLLFKQMEEKKYRDEGTKIEAIVKKEEVKQEMEIAEKKITNKTAKSILKAKERRQSKTGKSVVLKEIYLQTMIFKQKLEEKKKKFKLKINLINNSSIGLRQKSCKKLPSALKKITEEHLDRYCYKSKSTNNKKSKNVFNEMFYDLEFSRLPKSSRFPKHSNIELLDLEKVESKSILYSHDFSNDESNKNLIDLKNRIVFNDNNVINKNEINENNTNEDDELILSLESNNGDDSSELNLNIPSQSCKTLPYAFKSDKLKEMSAKITKKRNFQIKIKENISEYCQGYLDYFMDNIADKIIDEYQITSINASKELINDQVNYYNEEKQMTFLIDDDDETYKNQIDDVIKGLRDEAENKKQEVFKKYYQKFENINDKYSINSNDLFSCHEIEMLKEKFKLDLTKEINSFVLK
jgi:hypothetical protein